MTTAVKLLDENVHVGARREFGSLEIQSREKKIKLPLEAVDITSKVADRLAHVCVTQTFSNPYKEHVEAVYIFPLSGGCAVSSFEMKVGKRVIKGRVDERGAARADYNQALNDGKRTALLELERENVFTVQVGNLPPGEEITVIVSYSEKLAYFEDGTTEIRLPLVVAPRYIPGGITGSTVGDGVELDTDQVPDASRITPPRLVDGVDPHVRLSLKVVLEGTDMIEDLVCSQHATKIGTSSDSITIALSREDERLNRDFVVRWRVANDTVQSRFLVYQNPESKGDSYGMLSLVPPRNSEIASAPRDIVFVVDRSGSMQGLKMVSAARACSYLLRTLSPHDRFAIQAFDTVMEWMPAGSSGDGFIDADEAGIEEGINYLRTIQARGGTELHHAMIETISALKKRSTTTGRQSVCILLTDGQVGNESAIIADIQRALGDLRVFTVGIDTASNDAFLCKLAAIGGGTATFVQPGTELETALSQVSREVGTPLISGLRLENVNCGLDVSTLAPQSIPDLFEGRALTVMFRLGSGELVDLQKATIRVKGTYADGSVFQEDVSADVTGVSSLPQLWAKTHIVDLEDKYRLLTDRHQVAEREALQKDMVKIAVEHSLLTKFTAFVVIDEEQIVNVQGQIRKVVQPVENPHLWQMQSPQQMQNPQSQSAQFFSSGSSAQVWGAAPGMVPHSAPPGSWQAFAPVEPLGAGAASGMAPPSAPSGDPKVKPRMMGRNHSPSEGSYGSGVRAQVFEVCVRQAMQNPAWREITAGPMQVNNISPEEVEAEVQRRRNLASAPSSAAPTSESPAAAPFISTPTPSPSLVPGATSLSAAATASSPTNTGASEVKSSLQRLEKILAHCFAEIDSNRVPDATQIDEGRFNLLGALAKSSFAAAVPKLQKYLRADLIKFIAAITGVSTVTKQIQSLSAGQKKVFYEIYGESMAVIESSIEKPFWTTTV
jgi:Ca-activated chloride channel homolog